jgi:hypothetical protein
LTQEEKKALLEKGLVLVREICKNEKLLHKIGITPNRIKAIISESNELCSIDVN